MTVRCQLLDLGAWADEKYKVPVGVQETESVNENSEPSKQARILDFPAKDQLN